MSKQQYPEACVGALIFNSQGKMFLMESYKWGKYYVMPGGRIELGETKEQALKREIKEETGLIIFDLKFLLFQEYIYDQYFWKKRHFLFFDYYCKTKSTRVIHNREVSKHIWVEPKDSLKLAIEPYTRRAIKKYLQNSLGVR